MTASVPAGTKELAIDAGYLRDIEYETADHTEAVAARLLVITDREKWSTRELATWCRQQLLTFGTQQRVHQLLGYSRVVSHLRTEGLTTAVVSEGSVRPLVQLLNRGSPVEKCASTRGAAAFIEPWPGRAG